MCGVNYQVQILVTEGERVYDMVGCEMEWAAGPLYLDASTLACGNICIFRGESRGEITRKNGAMTPSGDRDQVMP